LKFETEFFAEFVKLYSLEKEPLSSDAFSKFCYGVDDSKEDNAGKRHAILGIMQAAIERATQYLLECRIPAFVNGLSHFVSVDPFAIIDEFHRYGVNIRYLGYVPEASLPSTYALQGTKGYFSSRNFTERVET
jgi:hypothetical protein